MCYSAIRCEFNSTELIDAEFIRSEYYNKLELLRFSSNVGKFVGYTELGVKTAEHWNKDPGQLAQMRAQKEMYCKPNIKLFYKSALTKSGEFVFHTIYHCQSNNRFTDFEQTRQ